MIKSREEIDLQQTVRTNSRLPCASITSSVEQLQKNNVPFSELIVLNKGEKFTPIEEKASQESIPKVIHQAILGEK